MLYSQASSRSILVHFFGQKQFVFHFLQFPHWGHIIAFFSCFLIVPPSVMLSGPAPEPVTSTGQGRHYNCSCFSYPVRNGQVIITLWPDSYTDGRRNRPFLMLHLCSDDLGLSVLLVYCGVLFSLSIWQIWFQICLHQKVPCTWIIFWPKTHSQEKSSLARPGLSTARDTIGSNLSEWF